jgi:hypothetical protein
VAGAAALLLSAMRQGDRRVRAIDIKRALTATALPVPGATVLDAGAGVPDVLSAYRWLLAAHQAGVYRVEALNDNGGGSGWSAAYRRTGLESAADTVQRFRIASVGGQPAARLLLEPDQPWLRAPRMIEPGGAPATVTVTYDAARLVEPGLYVGTVWARPATDTMAGPAFGLTNTIVVPHELSAGILAEDKLGPGEYRRHYLSVPEGSGGLAVRLITADKDENATLYLFEPTGQPHRGGSAEDGAGSTGSEGTIVVAAEDVVAGVYEAVVVAPPARGVRYVLESVLPDVVPEVTSSDGVHVTLRNSSSDRIGVTVSTELVGAARDTSVHGMRDRPETVLLRAPAWAERMVVDVALPVEVWQQLTDFGVTVFDSSGLKIADGPLHYSFGRLELALDSAHAGRRVAVELFPGFAHLEPPREWTADIRVAFLAGEAVRLAPVGQAAEVNIEVSPGDTIGLSYSLPPELDPPQGFTPLVAVTVEGPGWIRAVRHATVAPARVEPIGR